MPFYGTAILCLDDKNLKRLVKKINTRNIITYSIKNKKADVYVSNIVQSKLSSQFKLNVKSKKIKILDGHEFTIKAIGTHNILNGTASIIASKLLGIKNNRINKGLINYNGVKRRFTFLGKKMEL